MKAIGVFDSGVGGLTVLKALRIALPHREFLYLGDTARVPYGRKPAAMVREFAREITSFLAERGAEAVVVACNTATAVALGDLQHEFTLPIWGVIEPGVEAALRTTRSGRVGVIGTSGTIASQAYQKRLEARGLKVWAKACPLFVHLVEEGLADSPEAELLARHYLGDHPDIDTLILGCTHYPVLTPVLLRVLGPGVQLVSSATVAAESVRDALGDAENTAIGRITHFVTGDPIAYEHTAAVIGGVDGKIISLPIAQLKKALAPA
ncbi:MAG: glutamate racemase [Acidobacteriota bacterium]|nr:glutamate racemase [Acidobacteriota bacterium]